jgi:hypothetical protein
VEQDKQSVNGVYSKRVKAGKRRTYFFDVKPTKGNDYFLTITESVKNKDDQYDKHKIFIYKEDFVKFIAALEETVAHIKQELLPDFDFDAFNHDEESRPSLSDDNNANTQIDDAY